MLLTPLYINTVTPNTAWEFCACWSRRLKQWHKHLFVPLGLEWWKVLNISKPVSIHIAIVKWPRQIYQMLISLFNQNEVSVTLTTCCGLISDTYFIVTGMFRDWISVSKMGLCWAKRKILELQCIAWFLALIANIPDFFYITA